MRSLSLWDGLWCLLKLHMLLIREVAIIVNHLERIPLLAILTIVRLKDTAS
jgi:hypothetical protein